MFANDIVFGNDGKDRILGQQGNDVLDGGDLNDVLVGGNGDDLLIGGSGRNTLFGNQGSDIFVLDTQGINRILDYEDGIDKLFLGSDLQFSDLNIQSQRFGVQIRLISNNQTLANINNVSRTDITQSDFF